MTLEYWGQFAKDVTSTISLDADDLCLEILSSSYNHMSVHLKPCFLYMSTFPEDYEICVSKLYNLWIAEGFLKPIEGKSLEEIAENVLKELVGRNLVLVDNWSSSGKIKSCKLHDLLRDLSLREALKEKFFCVIGADNLNVSHMTSSQRRIVFIQRKLEKNERVQTFHSLQSSAPLTRSLVCYDACYKLPPCTLRLLRVLNVVSKYGYLRDIHVPLEGVPILSVNSRYIAVPNKWEFHFTFLSSLHQMRNIQTLEFIGYSFPIDVPCSIWNFPQLRRIKFSDACLSNPTLGLNEQQDSIVLENLHTLAIIRDFQCSKEILRKIPNIRNLKIRYDDSSMESKGWAYYSLQNRNCFKKLESFACYYTGGTYYTDRNVLTWNISYPHSLKKLVLYGCRNDMTMIGLLPHLEVLKLRWGSLKGSNWNPIEGEFLCLKVLQIQDCYDLVNWNADSSHFPCLEQLVLHRLPKLKEIPLDIGEIPTLRMIRVWWCNRTAMESAKKILEEQQNNGNVNLQVDVKF